jgi:hypothetical protein
VVGDTRHGGSPNAEGRAFSGTDPGNPYAHSARARHFAGRRSKPFFSERSTPASQSLKIKLQGPRSAVSYLMATGSRIEPLPLPALHTRVLLVDHINPATASHHAAILVAYLGGTQAVTNSHDALLTRADEGRLRSCPFLRCQARRWKTVCLAKTGPAKATSIPAGWPARGPRDHVHGGLEQYKCHDDPHRPKRSLTPLSSASESTSAQALGSRPPPPRRSARDRRDTRRCSA